MNDNSDNKECKADSMVTRVSLIGKAKDQSDDRAWTEFVSYYRKYIYNIVRRMGLAHHDADEVVQLTLLKIWNAMPSFEYAPSKGRFRGWICRITGNTAKNFVRDKGPVPLSLSSREWDGDDMQDYSVEPEVEADMADAAAFQMFAAQISGGTATENGVRHWTSLKISFRICLW